MYIDNHFSSVGSVSALRPSIRTLMLDDCAFDRARLKRSLSETSLIFDVEEVASLSQFEEALRAKSYDLFLIDYRLPTGNGLDALALARRNPNCASAAKLMIAGWVDEDIEAAALRIGCQGVMPKDSLCRGHLEPMLFDALFDVKYAQVGQRNQSSGWLRQA